MRLCDCLVNSFVLLDASEEVPLCVFARRVLVVGVTHTDFQRNVGSDGSRVITDRLEEYKGHSFLLCNPLFNISPVGNTVSGTDIMRDKRGIYLRSLVLLVASDWECKIDIMWVLRVYAAPTVNPNISSIS